MGPSLESTTHQPSGLRVLPQVFESLILGARGSGFESEPCFAPCTAVGELRASVFSCVKWVE